MTVNCCYCHKVITGESDLDKLDIYYFHLVLSHRYEEDVESKLDGLVSAMEDLQNA